MCANKRTKQSRTSAMTNGNCQCKPCSVIIYGRASTFSKCDMLYLQDVMAAGDKEIYHWGGNVKGTGMSPCIALMEDAFQKQ